MLPANQMLDASKLTKGLKILSLGFEVKGGAPSGFLSLCALCVQTMFPDVLWSCGTACATPGQATIWIMLVAIKLFALPCTMLRIPPSTHGAKLSSKNKHHAMN